ncbi:MAG: hypothetical protein JW924_08490 [Fusobacteriaceae bacterium]|nr:hypothetical protein [Fusobacteriaceae bacterium]
MFGNLINDSNERELQRMREKHEKTLQKMRLKSKLNIERNKLNNELTLNQLENEENQIDVKRKIFRLKNIVRKDDLTVKAGKKLKFWAILVTLISTLITISGGYQLFTKNIYTLIAFISAVVILQLTVFIISSQETRIKQDFNRHYLKCMLLKYSLLVVSIYNNYKFFEVENMTKIMIVITILLCVAIDLIAVFMVSLAYDQITLNVFYNTDKNIIAKFADNATFKYRDKINNRYKDNLKKEKSKIVNDIKELKKDMVKAEFEEQLNMSDYNKKQLEKGTYEVNENSKCNDTNKIGYEIPMTQVNSSIKNNNFNKDDVKSYINSMYELSEVKKNNESVGQTKIEKHAGLTNKQMRFIRVYLEKLNIIKVSDRKTHILTSKEEALKKLNCYDTSVLEV